MKSTQPLSEISTEELRSLIRTKNAINSTVGGISAIILLGWMVLGYWEKNSRAFISTIALSLVILAALYTSGIALRKELKNREKPASATDGDATH